MTCWMQPIKASAIEMISELCSEKAGTSQKELYYAFMEREALDSTGFGEQLAIPHAKVSSLLNPLVAVIRFKEGIDWDAQDNQKVMVAIALVMPNDDKENVHLTVLSKLARKLVHPEFMQMLLTETDEEKLYQYIIGEMED